MAVPLVVARGLGKRFTRRGESITALDGIDLTLSAGRIMGLVGPDGAGKSTLMRLVAGLLAPDAGSVAVAGRDLAAEPGFARPLIGYMPQRLGLYEDLTVTENLNLHAELQDVPRADRPAVYARLLDFTGLASFERRLVGELSGGMKQKLGLACDLIGTPRVLLLDEPTVGVDPLSRRELWRMISDLVRDGIAVLWSTGYLDEAERCAEVLLIDRGRLLYAGPPDGYSGRIDGRVWTVQGAGEDRRKLQGRLDGLPQVVDAILQGPGVRIVLEKGATPPTTSQLGNPAAAVEPVQPRIEDACRP